MPVPGVGSGTSKVVLIETYWNVNHIVAFSFIPYETVLIETYWNVNVVMLVLSHC